MTSITAYSDGSCNIKTREGGVGILLLIDNQEKHISVGYSNTTISRMEMRGVLFSIKEFPINEAGDLTIYSDSQFVVNSFNKGWLKTWIMQDFVDRKNADIWKEIVSELKLRPNMKFSIIHTRGHQKDLTNEINYGNAVADILASYKNFKIFIKDF